VALLATTILLGTIATVRAEQRYFVCVGVDHYDSAVLSPLRGAENDARIIANSLIAYGGFLPPGKGSYLLLGSSKGDTAATKRSILTKIAAVASRAREDDVFLLFFAGHGIERARESFLLPVDANPASGRLVDSAVAAERLRDTLERMRAKKRVFVLDCCRNDPLPSRSGTARLEDDFVRGLKKKLHRPNPFWRRSSSDFSVILYACGPDERAFEYPRLRPIQGFFSHFFSETLRDAAKAQRALTVPQLVRTLEKRVSMSSEREIGVPQVPWAKISGRFVDEWSIVAGMKPEYERLLLPDVAPTPAYESPDAVGNVRVDSEPEGAFVYLRGTDTGRSTPTMLTGVHAGVTVVTLKKRGYLSEVKQIAVRPGETTGLRLDLRSKAGRRPKAY